jgi:putative PIG3 family NAD(P)H quinone oxidoreductase
MNFIGLNDFGDSDVMVMGQCAVPTPQADELLVKVKAIGVNRADILQRQGKYPAPAGESDILGLEVCGEVVESNDPYWKGKLVFGLVAGGAYAEYCVLKREHAFELDEKLSFTDGAAIAEVFLTAYQALIHIGRLEAGKTALIHAGASGVGTDAIQLVKAIGAKAIVTVGSEDKAQFCRKLGADLAINYKTTDFVAEVKGYCKSHQRPGVDVVVDCVAGEYIGKDINCLGLDGHIVVLAMMGGRFAEQLDMAKMLAKRATISASTLRNRSHQYKTDLITQFKTQFEPLLASGQLKSIVDQVFDWKNVGDAHRYIEANKNKGKVVLRVS